MKNKKSKLHEDLLKVHYGDVITPQSLQNNQLDITYMQRILGYISDCLFWKNKFPKSLSLDQEEYEWAILYLGKDILTIGIHQVKLKQRRIK